MLKLTIEEMREMTTKLQVISESYDENLLHARSLHKKYIDLKMKCPKA